MLTVMLTDDVYRHRAASRPLAKQACSRRSNRKRAGSSLPQTLSDAQPATASAMSILIAHIAANTAVDFTTALDARSVRREARILHPHLLQH